jgi:phospholipid/cholesterol/gamma-HCH transport system substrate-binding protein
VKRLLVLVAAMVALAGCGSQGLAGIPLPGGAAGGDSYGVTIQFRDVLDLVPQSAVKVNDVTVGDVRGIKLTGWHATVSVRVRKSVDLPANAIASIRQTSLLGEKFVDLSEPPGKGTGRLRDGARIPLSRTTENVEVEQVLGAMSLLLNGGSLDKLKTINSEVAKIFEGRESSTRDALDQLDTFVGGLDDQKAQIVRAIDGLDTLSKQLAGQQTTVANAIDALDPGLKVLDDQRKQLVAMLSALSNLGAVGTKVINASKADLVANLQSLQPILTELVASGDNLPKSLDQLLTYPFPPNVTSAIVGDYVNLHVTVDLNLTDVLSNIFTSTPVSSEPGTTGSTGSTGSTSGTGTTGSNPLGSILSPAPTGPDGQPLPPGEANSQQGGGLLGLLLGGLSK